MTRLPISRTLLVTFAVLALWCSGTCRPTAAKDMNSLYADETLEYWGARYERGIMSRLQMVVWPALTPAEQERLSSVSLELPLRSPDGDPFDFYAKGPPPRVYLPVLSLKFLDDMAVAWAWLNRNGYTLETVPEYVAMLKYRTADDFGGAYPAPLHALHVPDDALTDPAVESLANRLFDSAVIFVLLHELGHVYYEHPGYGSEVPREQARANEAQADAFALEVMRRLGEQPAGMLILFSAWAYASPKPGDYARPEDYQRAFDEATHPLSEDRLRAIAHALKAAAPDFARHGSDLAAQTAAVEFIADNLLKVAGLLDDADMQDFIYRNALATTLASLAPRRPGQMLGLPEEPATWATSGEPFDGVYTGELSDGTNRLPVQFRLHREGDRVFGEYTYDTVHGELTGLVSGDRLTVEWREGELRGHGAFTAEQDGAVISGTWGGRDSLDNGGTWRATRRQ